METIKKNDLRYILNVYDQLKNDMKISNRVEKAYNKLPENLKSNMITPQGKILAINRFVLFNYNKILEKLGNDN
jgi:mRNA-degrading endonuclease HigB of HigAB toxin-antitoxin module